MNASEEKHLRQAVGAAADTGHLGGLIVEFWRGGGLPPPYYRSEQLRLLTEEGTDSVVFANLIFDKKFNPPEVQEKWTVTLPAEDVREIMGLLRESGILEGAHATQPPAQVADRFTTEIIVSLGETQILRKFGPKLPDHFSKLEDAFQKLIATAKEKSHKTLYHQGKKVD